MIAHVFHVKRFNFYVTEQLAYAPSDRMYSCSLYNMHYRSKYVTLMTSGTVDSRMENLPLNSGRCSTNGK